MFAAPPEQQLEWSDSGVEGAARYLRRLWNLSIAQEIKPTPMTALSKEDQACRREIHTVLKQANFDYSRIQYNTVVSACMKMLNTLEQAKEIQPSIMRECLGILLRVLYPIVPHITQYLWQHLQYEQEIAPLLDAPWPEVDESALIQDELTLMLQVNGKLKGEFVVPVSASKEEIEALALQSEAAQRALAGQSPKKVIVVPGRLVNVVI
jgi:leucyl-tRNA synthetase